MLESLNYSFRNPKKHNLRNLPHQTVEKLQKNHGVLRGTQLGKQCWRARLGILRVKADRHVTIVWKSVSLNFLEPSEPTISFYLYLELYHY